MSSFGVVLDTSVLLPAALRDTLLRAAAEGLYRPHWSEDILEELRRNLVNKLGKSELQAGGLVGVMHENFPEAIVEGYESLIPTMDNDPKDRHVLAAAVVANAQAIVTQNLRHFPREVLDRFSIQAQSPDAFLSDLLDLEPELLMQIVGDQAADLRRPTKTTDDVISSLAQTVPSFASDLRGRFERPTLPDLEDSLLVRPVSVAKRGQVFDC